MADRENGRRWVMVVGIGVAVVVLLFVAVRLIDGDEHGPGRHGDPGNPTPPVGHTPPAGHR